MRTFLALLISGIICQAGAADGAPHGGLCQLTFDGEKYVNPYEDEAKKSFDLFIGLESLSSATSVYLNEAPKPQSPEEGDILKKAFFHKAFEGFEQNATKVSLYMVTEVAVKGAKLKYTAECQQYIGAENTPPKYCLEDYFYWKAIEKTEIASETIFSRLEPGMLDQPNHFIFSNNEYGVEMKCGVGPGVVGLF